MKSRKILSTLAITLSLTLLSPLSYKASSAETTSVKALPSVAAKAAITIDYDTGEIIYAKDIDAKKYPASTTKLMTSLLFAENKTINDTITYTEEAKAQPAFSMNTNMQPIEVGQEMTADDVMKALLLYSANDSAYMIADAVGGSSAGFAELMNKKAQELNMTNTHFITPNGLHDENHYTTAYDLSLLGKAAYSNEWVREVMGTSKAEITINKTAVFPVENRNENLGKNGCIGGKTGYTQQAGRCLVALYERDGRKIIGVVLDSTKDEHSPQVFKDMESIINYSYGAEQSTLTKAGTEIGKISVNYKAFKFFGPTKTIEAPVILDKDISVYSNSVNLKENKTEIASTDKDGWSLASSPSTKVNFSVRDYKAEYTGTANIKISQLLKANAVIYIITIAVILVVLFLASLIFKARKNSYRRRRRY
ncbi:MAG: D-alanyl-D-alanine carboxypeptidase family protein [Clostridiaceae bacterium]